MDERIPQPAWASDSILKGSESLSDLASQEVQIADCSQNPGGRFPILCGWRDKVQRIPVSTKCLLELLLRD
jgi:hypothetical protein